LNSWTARASKLSFLLFGVLRILVKSIVAIRNSRRLFRVLTAVMTARGERIVLSDVAQLTGR
jgi:hypothetical protein